MIRREAGYAIGTVTLGGRRFAVRVFPTGVAQLCRCLVTHDRVILTAPGQDPLVVLRLGDLLRDHHIKQIQQEGSKTSVQVSRSVTTSDPGTKSRRPPTSTRSDR